jgi:hypothetical protein
VANLLLQALHLILFTTLATIEAALLLSGFKIKFSDIELPQDVRTAYQHHIPKPKIIWTVCCPRCFSLIPRLVPWTCQWKPSARSRPCNTILWKRQYTRKGMKLVPQCLYTTQDFDSWLKFFLSRPVIEDSLEKTFSQRTNRSAPNFGSEMHDVQDSPAWRDLNNYLYSGPFNLLFGIYVDLFNAFGNKIAGEYKFSNIL